MFPDFAAAGRLVADHLLSRGFRYLAALRQQGDVGVALQAGAMKAFAKETGFDGWLGVETILEPRNRTEWRQGVRAIERWMATWKLPLGLLVLDARWARLIIELAHGRGWHWLRRLAVVFGDGVALDEVRRLALDDRADLADRRQAIESLIEARPADLREVCERLVKKRFVNTAALAGLTVFDDPAVGRAIAAAYPSFHPVDRPAVIAALASRPAFAPAVLDLLEKGTIGRGDLTAAQARQIRDCGDAALTRRLGELWGEVRDSPADKQATIAGLKDLLTAERLAAASPAAGRAVFTRHCATCHRLFGSGGELGPDLTGGDRRNLDYLLSNIVDPSAVVTKDFLVTRFVLTDGRVLGGIVVAENVATVTIQTPQERRTIPQSDVETRELSSVSLMPDGLLQPLGEQEIVDLVAYLRGDSQVALPAPAGPAP